jgi:hypothetical protein
VADISNLQLEQIAGTQLAIDAEIEQRILAFGRRLEAESG